MQHPEYLYHYTSVLNLPYIMESRYLKLTPSNLVKPKRYWKEPHLSGTGYSIVGDTDNIKPVVWMTEEDNVQKEEAFHIGYIYMLYPVWFLSKEPFYYLLVVLFSKKSKMSVLLDISVEIRISYSNFPVFLLVVLSKLL